MESSHLSAWQAVPSDRQWKYAYCERERRFLLGALPDQPEIKPAMSLRDKYLHGSHFRLRHADNGQSVEYKLQKKLRLEEGHTDQLWNSTIYISKAEYTLFEPLPGIWLEKRRTFYAGPAGETICVDEIQREGVPLWIAEVEFDSEAAMAAYAFPWDFQREITNVPGWSSFDLAGD